MSTNPFSPGDEVQIDISDDRMIPSSPRYDFIYEVIAVQGVTCWIKRIPGNRERMNTDPGIIKYCDDLRKVCVAAKSTGGTTCC